MRKYLQKKYPILLSAIHSLKFYDILPRKDGFSRKELLFLSEEINEEDLFRSKNKK